MVPSNFSTDLEKFVETEWQINVFKGFNSHVYDASSTDCEESSTQAVTNPFASQEEGSIVRRWQATSADVRRLQRC